MKFTQKTASEIASKYTDKLSISIDGENPKTKNELLGAIKKCINVFQNYASEIEALEEVKAKALKDYSWKQIAEISKAGNADKYFNIGDEKEIELYTGEIITVVILDFCHDNCHDNLADSSSKAGITFGLKKHLDGEFEMNETNTNEGSWKESKMRKTYMQRFFKLLPSDLRKNIVEVKKLTSAGNESEEIIETVDKIFLFSEVECTGDTEYSVKGEGEQYKYFKKNGFSTGRWFWLRSPYSGGATYLCYGSSGGYIYTRYASGASCARLGFCL